MQTVAAKVVGLGQTGHAYVCERLRDVNGFCSSLLGVVEDSSGEVFTILPADASSEHAFDFWRGGLVPLNRSSHGMVYMPDGTIMVPTRTMAEEQRRLLREALAPNSACIVDDCNPRWTELDKAYWANAFHVDDVVYHQLTLADDADAFERALRASNAIWHGVAAVCGFSVTPDETRGVNDADLKACASTVRLLTCVAYDGEGFVAWRKPSE
jgi:hypothetical protein